MALIIKHPTKKHCVLGNLKAVFYTNPANVTQAQAFGVSNNGITVDQAPSQSKITRRKRARNSEQRKTFANAWWEFVFLFSKVFADLAEGECFVVALVPHNPSKESIWAKIELPALKNNSKITWVTCVDHTDNKETRVIFERLPTSILET